MASLTHRRAQRLDRLAVDLADVEPKLRRRLLQLLDLRLLKLAVLHLLVGAHPLANRRRARLRGAEERLLPPREQNVAQRRAIVRPVDGQP